MPIYEFECSSCGERFDRLQKLSDPDPDSCPNCGATGVRRRLTAPSFRLAGSGWYETDFKKDGDRKRNLAEKSDAAKAEAKPAEAAAKADAPAKADKPAAGEKASASSTAASASKPSGKSEASS
jgi:putative FmdB family regulatory protein